MPVVGKSKREGREEGRGEWVGDKGKDEYKGGGE